MAGNRATEHPIIYGAPGGIYWAPGGIYGSPGGIYGAPGGIYEAPGGVYGAPAPLCAFALAPKYDNPYR